MGFIVLESESVAIKAGVTATSRQASRAGVCGYMPLPCESSLIIKTAFPTGEHWTVGPVHKRRPRMPLP